MRKNGLAFIVLCLFVILLIPWTIMRWVGSTEHSSTDDFQIRVLMPDGKVDTMALETYLIGVVGAEMPAEFNAEALKAQAVAARTYAAKRLSATAKTLDPGYDVDTTVKTQAWASDSQMRKRWGWFSYNKYRNKIKDAVEATKGQVLIYEGDYVDAYYHSSSGRKPTERSEDVWSSSRPYLQNIDSGETEPLRFVNQYTFTPQELYEKLSLSGVPQAFANGDFQVVSKTAAGRVKTVRLLGKVYQATQLRTLLGLSSTDMECTLKVDQIVFTTYGNGHGVGMSQYGANDLAKGSLNYQEILGHYYPGVKLLTLNKNA